jgi:hypothetical protein
MRRIGFGDDRLVGRFSALRGASTIGPWRTIYDCLDESGITSRGSSDRSVVAMELRLVQAFCDLLVVHSADGCLKKWPEGLCVPADTGSLTRLQFTIRTRSTCVPNDLSTGNQEYLLWVTMRDWATGSTFELMTQVSRKANRRYTFVLTSGGGLDVKRGCSRGPAQCPLLGTPAIRRACPNNLYHFVACIIPFKLNAITEATDP